jgi:hypothetical protein
MRQAVAVEKFLCAKKKDCPSRRSKTFFNTSRKNFIHTAEIKIEQ